MHWHCIVVCTGYFTCLADGLFASSNAGIRGLFKAASGFLSKYPQWYTIVTPLIWWVVSPRHNFNSVNNSSNATKPWGVVSIVVQLRAQNKGYFQQKSSRSEICKFIVKQYCETINLQREHSPCICRIRQTWGDMNCNTSYQHCKNGFFSMPLPTYVRNWYLGS